MQPFSVILILTERIFFMRMCMKVSMNTETTNKALKDGTLIEMMQTAQKRINPEAAYFATDNGVRTAFYFFNMTDSSQMPMYCENFFIGANANVQFFPVMNSDELTKGLDAWKKTLVLSGYNVI